MRNDKLFQYIKTIIFIWLGASFAMSQSEINPHYSIRASQSRRAANVLAIPSGKEAVVGEMDGPAVIRHIWMTAQSDIPQIQGLLTLRAYWDDETSPSVEVPLGDFFGVGFGQERNMKSAMSEMFPAGGENHSALNCYWQMPFFKKARFTIENRSTRAVSLFFFQADYEKMEALPPNTALFHAQWRRENPVRRGVPYTIIEATGEGHYVGTVMNYRLLESGAWVEGGNDVYIDGESKPSLPGTGAEDYFGFAWGFRTEENAHWHGTSFGPENDRMSTYRWHIPDPIRFKKSLRMTMRCHGYDVGDRSDDYSSVAFWYQKEPHAPFPKLPPVDYDYLDVAEEFRIPPLEAMKQKMPEPPKGRNLALDVKVWRESGHNDPDQTGAMAFDGDPQTKWCEITNPEAHWLALDLNTERTINGFIIKCPSFIGDASGYDVVAFFIDAAPSLDGPWKNIVEFDRLNDAELPEAPSAFQVIKLDATLLARCVRLSITKSCPFDSIARIQEFEIWGE
ncbi:MAG TPA: DUF2961 domain-containing protein [Candidatus Sumerlaeota bacterium]|nr:DUF2961 domain-containing protein [Candidatus Sumerlaeota bacterium]HOR65181.1 DUF2961 domain-containing protein [Candidatus Sumerlaeota bacterium]HPL75136.1 DUF2961 domain-containing protein [Candidatus Sumerlaeota bacterium]